jgi:signal transduction histidine kinase
MSERDIVQGLEELRNSGRASISRALHDEIGPSLCSAGLLLGLLRSESQKWPEESREWLGTLQTALNSAMESARLLSYRTDPGLVKRCGLQSALEYLVRGTSLSLDWSAGFPDWTPDQNEGACRIVRDVILAIPGHSMRLEISSRGIALYGEGPLNLDQRRWEALRLVARSLGLELLYELPMPAARFSLGPLEAE